MGAGPLEAALYDGPSHYQSPNPRAQFSDGKYRPFAKNRNSAKYSSRFSAVGELQLQDYELTWRPDIQALRAVAVLLVVIFHTHLTSAQGGFIGVDVFFVISGFVITGVLLQERARTQRTSLLDFYARRIRRIVPATTITMIIILLATYHWSTVFVGDRVAGDAKWVAAFLANIHFAIVDAANFGHPYLASPIKHYWSLSVEEQFYVVWPLLFMAIMTLAPRRFQRVGLVAGLLLIIVYSFLWSIKETNQNQIWAYVSTLTRAWELCVGALLAVVTPLLRRHAPRLGLLLSVIGCIILGMVTWVYEQGTTAMFWPGWRAAIPVVATGLIIVGGTLREREGFGRLINASFVQWLGAISFSLYLVHFPILLLAEQQNHHYFLSGLSNIGIVALSVVLASLSYTFVEQPFQRSRLLKEVRWLTFFTGAVLICLTYEVIYWLLGNSLGI